VERRARQDAKVEKEKQAWQLAAAVQVVADVNPAEERLAQDAQQDVGMRQ
jgi:hypothetical protein